MTSANLIKRLEPWKSEPRLSNLIIIINIIDEVFGLNSKYVRALLQNHSCPEWIRLRSFVETMKEWKEDPNFDIVTKMRDNPEWFDMVVSVDLEEIDTRITDTAELISRYRANFHDSLRYFRRFVESFCEVFASGMKAAYADESTKQKSLLDEYRKRAYEENPHFTSVDALEFYSQVCRAIIYHMFYARDNVFYAPKNIAMHGDKINIGKMVRHNSSTRATDYVLMHNVNAYIRRALNHVALYDWMID